MPKPVDYLRSRSLPLLALVEAARIVAVDAERRKVRFTVEVEPYCRPEQLPLEGIR